MDVFVRIALRYLAGFLIARGFLDANTGGQLATDPDILFAAQIVVGFAVAAASEGWYYLAKHFGWRT